MTNFRKHDDTQKPLKIKAFLLNFRRSEALRVSRRARQRSEEEVGGDEGEDDPSGEVANHPREVGEAQRRRTGMLEDLAVVVKDAEHPKCDPAHGRPDRRRTEQLGTAGPGEEVVDKGLGMARGAARAAAGDLRERLGEHGQIDQARSRPSDPGPGGIAPRVRAAGQRLHDAEGRIGSQSGGQRAEQDVTGGQSLDVGEGPLGIGGRRGVPGERDLHDQGAEHEVDEGARGDASARQATEGRGRLGVARLTPRPAFEAVIVLIDCNVLGRGHHLCAVP